MGFSRRRMEISAADAEDYTSYQVGAMDAFLTAAGLRLHHVKPHGALYALALEDDGIAAGIARAVARLHPGTLLYTLKGSAMWAQAQAHGLRPVAEFYADRPLHRDGSYEFFRWRELFDPLPEMVAARVLTALTSGLVPSVEGPSVAVEVDSISIHADTPGAELVAQAIWRALEGAGITPKAL